jgi:hypothetical protein
MGHAFVFVEAQNELAAAGAMVGRGEKIGQTGKESGNFAPAWRLENHGSVAEQIEADLTLYRQPTTLLHSHTPRSRP